MNDTAKLNDMLSTLPNTTAGRRIRRLATTRYAWVSKDIPVEVYQLAQTGAVGASAAMKLVQNARGTTRNLGRNALKRACDSVGKNKRERRALRTFHLLSAAQRMRLDVSHA